MSDIGSKDQPGVSAEAQAIAREFIAAVDAASYCPHDKSSAYIQKYECAVCVAVIVDAHTQPLRDRVAELEQENKRLNAALSNSAASNTAYYDIVEKMRECRHEVAWLERGFIDTAPCLKCGAKINVKHTRQMANAYVKQELVEVRSDLEAHKVEFARIEEVIKDYVIGHEFPSETITNIIENLQKTEAERDEARRLLGVCHKHVCKGCTPPPCLTCICAPNECGQQRPCPVHDREAMGKEE